MNWNGWITEILFPSTKGTKVFQKDCPCHYCKLLKIISICIMTSFKKFFSKCLLLIGSQCIWMIAVIKTQTGCVSLLQRQFCCWSACLYFLGKKTDTVFWNPCTKCLWGMCSRRIPHCCVIDCIIDCTLFLQYCMCPDVCFPVISNRRGIPPPPFWFPGLSEKN